MSGVEGRAALAKIAADQWGLLTTAQAVAAGVPRMMLSRMAERGELERLAQGVYATPAAVGDELTERRAAWLSLDPGTPAYARLERPEAAGVLSHATAAAMYDIGDILESRIEVTLPARYRSRREDIRAYRAVLDPGEVTLVEGLPVTTPARTVADLIRTGHDRDHVATAMADALRRDLTNPADLERALDGSEPGRTGKQVLAGLKAAAAIDEESLALSIVTSDVGAAATRAAALGLALDWIRESGEPLPTQERRAEMIEALQAVAYARLPRGASTMDTWRTLQMSEKLAAADNHDDEDDERDDERSEATT
jgi:predicted transcriptional regulator of viral defense system